MRRSALVISAMFILALISFGTAYASVYIFDYSSQTVSVQTPSVALAAGNTGSSIISSVAPDAATTTVSSTTYQHFVAITLTNSQKSAATAGFQQEITLDPAVYAPYVSNDLGNIRFCSDAACITQLYSWLEGCGSSAPYGACSTTSTTATFWVKLTSPIAGNGGTLTIYMGFLPTSTDFDGIQAGEAPTLSGTYAQFDNGANVFVFYDNFAGTTINSAWNAAPAAGDYSVDNGLTIDSSPVPGAAFSLNSQYTGPMTIDAYQVEATGAWLGISFSNLQTSGPTTFGSGAVQWVYPPQGGDGYTGLCIDSGCTGFTPNPPATTLQVVTLAVNSTTATECQDYAGPVTASGTVSLTDYPGLATVAWNPSDVLTTYWFRLRAYPPSDVMPSVSFGSVTPNYILSIANQASSSWNVNLAVASSSNTGRLTNLTIWFYSPTSAQIRLGTAVTQLTTGPVVALQASGTLYIALYASSSASGSSTVALSLKIQLGSAGPYAQYTIYLTVN